MLIISHCILMSPPQRRAPMAASQPRHSSPRLALAYPDSQRQQTSSEIFGLPALSPLYSPPFHRLPPVLPSLCLLCMCARLCLFEFCHLAATLNDAPGVVARLQAPPRPAPCHTRISRHSQGSRIYLALLGAAHTHTQRETHTQTDTQQPQAQTVINDDSIAIAAIVTVLITPDSTRIH